MGVRRWPGVCVGNAAASRRLCRRVGVRMPRWRKPLPRVCWSAALKVRAGVCVWTCAVLNGWEFRVHAKGLVLLLGCSAVRFAIDSISAIPCVLVRVVWTTTDPAARVGILRQHCSTLLRLIAYCTPQGQVRGTTLTAAKSRYRLASTMAGVIMNCCADGA